LTFLQVATVGLESRDNVQDLTTTALTGTDRATVNHQSRTVETTESHEGTGHVLVTTGNNDHAVEPVAAGGSLDLVGDKVTRLE
jgi:hypothetical protein